VTLAGKVNMVLALRKGVDMTGLHVDAKDGVVTVSGHVDDQKQKDLVLTTVDSVKGVDTVVDKLNIGAQPVRPDAGN
jgi:osmotically-inducible protein OsmY